MKEWFSSLYQKVRSLFRFDTMRNNVRMLLLTLEFLRFCIHVELIAWHIWYFQPLWIHLAFPVKRPRFVLAIRLRYDFVDRAWNFYIQVGSWVNPAERIRQKELDESFNERQIKQDAVRKEAIALAGISEALLERIEHPWKFARI